MTGWVTNPARWGVPAELGDDVRAVPGGQGAPADRRVHRRPGQGGLGEAAVVPTGELGTACLIDSVGA